MLTDALARGLPNAIPNAFPVQSKENNIIANGNFINGLKGWKIWKNPSSLEIKTEIHNMNDNVHTNNKYVTLYKNGQGTGGLQTFFPVYSVAFI